MAQETPSTATNTGTALSESAIAAIIEERIRTGVYGPGARVPAERVLAAELGVSRRFIRMAFDSLIERGLMQKSHYRRPYVTFSGGLEAGGRGVAATVVQEPAGQTALLPIAAVLPSHPTFPGGLALVAGIHKVLADVESPYRLSFIDTFHRDRPEVLRRESKAIANLLREGISGLIWWYYSDDDTVLDLLRRYPGLPVVFIDRHPQDIHCDFAGIDDLESSRAAVDYLFDLNHTRIAHLMDPGSYSTILERAEGYRQAHIARGVPLDERLIVQLDWSENRAAQAFHKLFGSGQPPTALFTSNDFIAYEFIKYAESQGVRVPDDLSVVGHGNIDRYAAREFLTSVDQPYDLIGKAAARLLLKRLSSASQSPGLYQHVILHAPLIVRQSCRQLDRPADPMPAL